MYLPGTGMQEVKRIKVPLAGDAGQGKGGETASTKLVSQSWLEVSAQKLA